MIKRIHDLKGSSSFEERMSVRLVSGALILLGSVLYFASEASRWLDYQVEIKCLVLLLLAVAGITWLLDAWKTQVSRWVAVLGLVVCVYLGNTWLGIRESQVLFIVPTALAAALIGFPAALGTAGLATALLVSLPAFVDEGTSTASIVVNVAAVWILLGVMWATVLPMRGVVRWSWGHYQRARHLLERARDQQADLKQALEDLDRANSQLTRLNAVAQGLRQVAEDARTAKEQFVANVSHELRTPLNMIVGFSEMIVQSPETYGSDIPPTLLADLAVIYRNAAHLAELIDDVLDLSQIETSQMALTKERVSIPDIVQSAVVAVHPLFVSKGLYLEADIQPNLPSCFCDPTRIREVLLNLLSNAGRFTEQGGVQLRAWQEDEDVIVSLADTGPGIRAKDMKKLFEPFQQLDASIRRRYGGTGLGLCISRQFIELHGGRIWAESEPDRGTTFFFRLPLALPEPAEDGFMRWLLPDWEYLEHPRPSTAPKSAVRPRYVVFEHGDALNRLLTRYLNNAEIVSVPDLEGAVQELTRHPSRALLVNDVYADNALDHLKSLELPQGTAAIVCSVPGRIGSARAMGIVDYLVKPISRAVLLSALERLDLNGNTVLIVDDEPEALHLFRRMLASGEREYRVLRAKNGREALRVLRRSSPDVVLLDLVMPKMDGFQLLELKDQDSALADIPVIAISARDPAGQPIVSNALSVVRTGGISVQHILACIKALSEILSPTVPSAG